MSQQSFRKLSAFTGGVLVAGILSYTFTRLLVPALFPYWGSALLVLLGIWSAWSVHFLLIGSRYRWALLAFLIALCIGSTQVAWSGLAGLLLIVGAVFLLILLTLLGVVLQLLRRSPSPRLFLLAAVPLLAGTLMLGAANLSSNPSAASAQAIPLGEEVQALYEMDQRDRLTGRFILDATRDQARLQQILALDQQRKITAPQAQYQAALLLQHGTCPKHFQRAYQLAQAASEAKIPQAESLSQAAYDRWMLSINQPQKYNTQWVVHQTHCKSDPY
jgi:hypothetical protein